MDQPDGDPIRFGFIGAGAMAEFAVYPALYFAHISLEAICDIDLDRARYLATKFGTGRCYSNYADMFENEDLEAVIIQMHPAPRQEIVHAAISAGYHVLIPKPPAMTLDETRAISALARENNRHVMVNFESRFSFAVRQAKKIIASPEFGGITQYFSSFCSGTYGDEHRNRSTDYEDPIHAYLLDFTPHHLDLCRYFAGEIRKLALYYNQSDATGSFSLAFEFENGAVGTMQLNSNRLWWRNYDRIELTGQGEYLILDNLWTLKHYTKTQNTFSENYRDERSGELTGDAGTLREFVDAIKSDREPIASIHDCVQTMFLFQLIHDAVRDGRDGVILDR